MPRRYVDYSDEFGFWNKISRIGSVISLIGVVFFLYVMIERIILENRSVYILGNQKMVEWQGLVYPFWFHFKISQTYFFTVKV